MPIPFLWERILEKEDNIKDNTNIRNKMHKENKNENKIIGIFDIIQTRNTVDIILKNMKISEFNRFYIGAITRPSENCLMEHRRLYYEKKRLK